MNTELLRELAAEIRRETRVGAFSMDFWFKADNDPDDPDAGRSISEASEMQDQFDRMAEGRWNDDPLPDFKACGSAGCAAGTTLWIMMRKGERFDTGSIEQRAEELLDLPSGATSWIFRRTGLGGWEIAEIFDGLADGTMEWFGGWDFDDDPDEQVMTYEEPGLVFKIVDGILERVTDADLALLGTARRSVDVVRKHLLTDKKRMRIQGEILRRRSQADQLNAEARDLEQDLRAMLDEEAELLGEAYDREPF